MTAGNLQFGQITIDGEIYTQDIVIVNGHGKARNSSASRKWKEKTWHTPLSAEENIICNCSQLFIGTGMYGSLPVMDELKHPADDKDIIPRVFKTPEAVKHITDAGTNFVLHLTC